MIDDHFEPRPLPYWGRFATGRAEIECQDDVLRFAANGADEGQLTDAEIGDYRAVPPSRLPWKPPLRLTVRARMSHRADEMRGTAGFGFWNDPFDWLGNVAVPPSAVWFLFASRQSDMAFASGVPGNGWKAGSLNGGQANRLEMALGNFVFSLPGMSQIVFRLAQTRIHAHEVLLGGVDQTEWHTYRIDWLAGAAVFYVDDLLVLRAPSPPAVPLGFVAWIDNNCASVGAGREFRFSRLGFAQRQWMELTQVRIEPLSQGEF
ncbi:MAG: hypothetical protein M1482_01185 [Chloroflexi bacterium]|nr:hypothetical protein [Chloroflexota bacterium]